MRDCHTKFAFCQVSAWMPPPASSPGPTVPWSMSRLMWQKAFASNLMRFLGCSLAICCIFLSTEHGMWSKLRLKNRFFEMLLLKQSMQVKLTDAPNSNVDQTCRIALISPCIISMRFSPGSSKKIWPRLKSQPQRGSMTTSQCSGGYSVLYKDHTWTHPIKWLLMDRFLQHSVWCSHFQKPSASAIGFPVQHLFSFRALLLAAETFQSLFELLCLGTALIGGLKVLKHTDRR